MNALVALLRPRGWVKTALVLAPLLFGAKLIDPEAVTHTLLAALAYCLAASAGYVWNDYDDRAADRLHPTKRNRLLASGAVGPTQALALSYALGLGSLALAATLPAGVPRCVLASLAQMALYSFWLKRVAITWPPTPSGWTSPSRQSAGRSRASPYKDPARSTCSRN